MRENATEWPASRNAEKFELAAPDWMPG